MSLPTPTESQVIAGEKWIQEFYLTMDALDFDNFVSAYLDPAVQFNFVNMPPLKGHGGVKSILGAIGSSLTKLKHELNDVQILPDRIMAASTVIYDFVDGSHTEMKAFAILYKGLDDEKAHRYDIYGDFASVNQILVSIQAKERE